MTLIDQMKFTRQTQIRYFLQGVLKIFKQDLFAFSDINEAAIAFDNNVHILENRVEEGILLRQPDGRLLWSEKARCLNRATLYGLAHFIRRLGWEDDCTLWPSSQSIRAYWTPFCQYKAWRFVNTSDEEEWAFIRLYGYPSRFRPLSDGSFPYTGEQIEKMQPITYREEICVQGLLGLASVNDEKK
jgi:hypothetical protein